MTLESSELRGTGEISPHARTGSFCSDPWRWAEFGRRAPCLVVPPDFPRASTRPGGIAAESRKRGRGMRSAPLCTRQCHKAPMRNVLTWQGRRAPTRLISMDNWMLHGRQDITLAGCSGVCGRPRFGAAAPIQSRLARTEPTGASKFPRTACVRDLDPASNWRRSQNRLRATDATQTCQPRGPSHSLRATSKQSAEPGRASPPVSCPGR